MNDNPHSKFRSKVKENCIDFLIFDLDGTLMRTDDLERFRGRANIGPHSQSWTSEVANACRARRDRLHYTEAHLSRLAMGRKIGVFTRSPKFYATTLLRTMYPNTRWDSIICYEDVRQTKPDPEGILVAMKYAEVKSVQRVAVVGDEMSDIVASYRAGCWSFLDCGTWPKPMIRDNYAALERVPDMRFSGPEELIRRIDDPAASLLEAERQGASDQPKRIEHPRFDVVRHLSPQELGGESAFINVLGRTFSGYDALKSRADWHPMTEEITAHKNASTFPDHWIGAIREFIAQSWPVVNGRATTITVVPFKPNREPRLERLLLQLQQSHARIPIRPGRTIRFVPDMLRYREGVRGHSTEHLNQNQRCMNVRDHLEVTEPEAASGQHVIVIDDVVTTGASLIYADSYLRKAGARNVHCVALAHAVGPR